MIDYGASNLRSAEKAFQYVGADVAVTNDPDEIAKADKLVLPGVGAFGAGMAQIRAQGLEEPTQAAVKSGTPLLGICLGMQFLFDESDEMGEHAGLGLVAGKVTKFTPNGLKVPHMGWNQVEHDGTHPLLAGVESGAYAYFVHSYFCVPDDATATIGSADYPDPFCAIVAKDNVYGCQFHPEKSQAMGLKIIENFVNI